MVYHPYRFTFFVSSVILSSLLTALVTKFSLGPSFVIITITIIIIIIIISVMTIIIISVSSSRVVDYEYH